MSCQFLRLMLVKIRLSLQVEGCIRALSYGAISTQYLFEKLALSKTASHNLESSWVLFFSCERQIWVVWAGAWLMDALGDELFAVSLPLKMNSQVHWGQSVYGSGSSNEILVNCTGHLTLFALLMSALKSFTHSLALYVLYWLGERECIFHCGSNGLKSNDSWQRIAFCLCDHLSVVPFDGWRNSSYGLQEYWPWNVKQLNFNPKA